MIKLNRSDNIKLKKLFDIREDNIFLSSLYNEYLDNYDYLNFDYINSKEEFISSFLNYIGLDLKDIETLKKIKEYKLDKVKELDESKYKEDLFNKFVLPKSIKHNNYRLYYKEYNPYEGFIYDKIKIDNNFKEINRFGYFKNSYKYLALDKDDVTWMSVIPHEINTMKDDLECVKGNIAIYGLGLGYFLFHALNKKEVKKVKVIENDKNIIDIFNLYLRRYFLNLDKLTIINDDAIEFNFKSKDKFDYVYVDLYHNPIDSLEIYLKLKRNEKENSTYLYWIESDILAYLRRIIISILISLYYKDESVILSHDKNLNLITNSIKLKIETLNLDSFNKIFDLLKNENIIRLIKNIDLKLY